MIYLFWISIGILIYHLIGYGVFLKLLSLFRKSQKTEDIEIKDWPTITVLCPAFNEADVIESKINSFLKLDYPPEKIKMIVISDDSTDGTNEIVSKFTDQNIELVIQQPRKGKQSGHNLVEPGINSDYVLSTDANSIFKSDSVKKLVRKMYSHPEIAMVSGELKFISSAGGDSGEGLYWKYECWLKSLESINYSIIGANGSIFLIRRDLFQQIHPASVDDFERTLQVLKKGYIAKYEPEAQVFEAVTEKPVEELKRKIRIIAQQWFCLERNLQVFNPFSNTRVFLMFFSHKLIRWSLPLFSISLFISNFFLATQPFYFICLLIQLLIYCSGIFEIFLESSGKAIKIFKINAYFVAMNYSALIAFVKYISRSQFSTWDTIRHND